MVAACLFVTVLSVTLNQGMQFSTEGHMGVSEAEEKSAVELMRYVTPYSTSLDLMKDVSHHASNLEKPFRRYYSWVDTWASGPPAKTLWENGAGTTCQAVQPPEGQNGFVLSAETLWWPLKKEEPGSLLETGRVVEVYNAFSPSPFGQVLTMGSPTVSKVTKPAGQPESLLQLGGMMGNLLVDTNEMSQRVQLEAGETAKVYQCNDVKDVQRNMAHTSASQYGDSFLQLSQTWDLGDSHGVEFVPGSDGKQVRAKLSKDNMEGWEEGAPVFAAKTGLAHQKETMDHSFSAMLETSGHQANKMAQSKHVPIGFVKKITYDGAAESGEPNGSPMALVEITNGCPCTKEVEDAFRVSAKKQATPPSALVEVGVATMKDGQLILSKKEAVKKAGLRHKGHMADSFLEMSSEVEDPVLEKLANAHERATSAASMKKLPKHLQAQAQEHLPTSQVDMNTGDVSVEAMKEAGSFNSFLEMDAGITMQVNSELGNVGHDEEQVCVMRMPTATIGKTSVNFGSALETGQRMFAHFTGSGHGWEKTERKCGEFCDAEYTLNINGTNTEPMRLYREDCDQNPNSHQSGTWPYPRNGWCPGATANGHWLDVTHLVKAGGEMPIQLDTRVKGAEHPYSNMQGYAFNDKAMLQTSLTFHKWEGAGSPMEMSALETSARAENDVDGSPLRSNATLGEGAKPFFMDATGKTGRGDDGPWYETDSTILERDPPLYRVPMFTGEFHQTRNRLITSVPTEGPVGIDRTVGWRVAMRLKLEAPPRPFVGDEWDRVASIGYFAEEPTQAEINAHHVR